MKKVLERFSKKFLKSGAFHPDFSLFKYGLESSAVSFLASSLYQFLFQQSKKDLGKNQFGGIVVVTTSNFEAESMAAEALFFLKTNDVACFPGYEKIPYEYSKVSRELSLSRIGVIHRILNDERMLIFTSPSGILHTMPDPARLKHETLCLRLKKNHDSDVCENNLIVWVMKE